MNKKQKIGVLLFGGGSALMIEKIINYGAIYTYPPVIEDHGLLGLVLVVVSFFLLVNYHSLKRM